MRPSSGANLPLQDLLLNANARESINQRQCKLDILWNLKVLGSFLLCSIYMYDSPANVFLNSLALCFSLILLTLVLPSVSLFKVSVLQVVEKRGTHSELTSTGVHGSSPVSSVLSRRRLQPADLCGQQVLTSPANRFKIRNLKLKFV